MPISFPSSPTLNQEYSFSGRTWVWTGAVWQSVGTVQGATGSQGIQGIQGPQGLTGNNGFLAQTSSPGATDVLWLDTDEPAIANIPSSTVTTKGDLIVATAAGTVTRLGVGSNNQYLMADSLQSTGMRWVSTTAVGDDDQIVLATQVFR